LIGTIVYQWNGVGSSRAEKLSAVQYVLRIKDTPGRQKTTVYIIDEGRETPEFWSAIGGKGIV
jgi:hypothetical protein